MTAPAPQASFSLWRGMLLLLRPHHWIKNGFVLVPIFFGGQAQDTARLGQALLATLVFCLLSSAIYVMNDLRDIEADRQHVKKRHRPLPSGLITPGAAVAVLGLLLSGVGLLLWLLQPNALFLLIICLYAGLNIAYSLGLKQLALVEIFLVSSGYILRLIAGALISGEPLTHWIIACTGLVSLLLTVGKRRGDMAQANDGKPRRSLQRYSLPYLDHIMTMLAAATIVTYLLFTMSDYGQSKFGDNVMLSAVFVVFGIMRYLQIVMVESGGDQPTNLFFKDVWLITTVIGYVLFFLATIYLL